MESASRAPALVAGLARAAAAGSPALATTAVEMLSKLCLFSSQGYCLALQVCANARKNKSSKAGWLRKGRPLQLMQYAWNTSKLSL